MRMIFRADASRDIGSGHVMRSSVLAEEAISRGYECVFVGQILDLSWVSERISKLGFMQIIADEQLFIPNSETDVLILDSYSMQISNSFIDRKNWKLVLSICDQITPKYEVDIELHPGLEKTEGILGGPLVLSGSDYVLIRHGIKKSVKKKQMSLITKVLVVGGGSDTFGFVRAIAEVIRKLELNLEVHLFTNDNIPTVSQANFITHPIGFDLDFIANDVDLAFTTASTSSLEFIAREIPTGVACAVDNQSGYYEQLGRLGYAIQLGVRKSENCWEFEVATIKEMLESKGKRDSLNKSISGLIDFKGASRVMDVLASVLI